ncbi:MAG: phosphotransferase, partial [Micrococcales bacterium]|nr:phosphotransferase [Micrococcales bacterium]
MRHPLHEVDIDEPLVRALLAAQHPDLAALPLTRVGNGWDNVMFRLGGGSGDERSDGSGDGRSGERGDALAVRLPARSLAAPLIVHEQRWLPLLAPHLPVAVPVPVRLGRPGIGFPWPWSVVPWLRGTPADEQTPQQWDAWAEDLADALAALLRAETNEATANP